MKDELMAVGKGIPELACNLISNICPQFAAVSCVSDFIASVPNIIFADKLSRILTDDNKDFFEWLKIADHFDESHDTYQNSVRQLIYNINAINETKLLGIYANLLRAYRADKISKEELYRLGWALSNIFPGDLMYLVKCYGQNHMEETPELRKLEQRGLVCISRAQALYDVGVRNLYMITELGTKMLSCGIDYENHNKYQCGGKK